MKRVYAVILVCLSLALCVLASCISREAAENNVPREPYHTVTFHQGEMVLLQEAVKEGETIANYPEGFVWRDVSGMTVDPASVVVMQDLDLYVREPAKMRTGHVRYLSGENDFFRPDEYLTRGEAAGVVCALMEDTTVTGGAVFSDVTEDSDDYANVETASALGIMNGYSDGTFRPDEPITRGEMLAALCRLTGTEEVTALAFSDVGADHWSMGSVAAAMANGWVSGYEDGSFYPDSPITRAETVVLVDRVLGWSPNKTAIDQICARSPYRDLSRQHWAYYDIVGVSFSSELMAYILGEVEGIQPGFVLIDNDLCHVNPETLCLDYFEKGFHTITDGLASDGLYYVPENGYFIQRSKSGLQELDGSMFYVENDDGPFVTDYKLGYLQFGENGRYTSGSAEVDGYVDAIMAPIINGKTENLLKESNLRIAFDYIAKNGGYDYKTVPYGWKRGTTSWTLRCARDMYQTKKGSCFYWAAAFLYLARRLGYQAYPICGGVFPNNGLHAWVMIDEDGKEYIYDTELDWAFRTGAHGRTERRSGMDMFKWLRGRSGVTYIFPGDTYFAPPQDDTDLFGEMPNIIWPTDVNNVAYIEIDGEMVAMETTWSELYDEEGNMIGYTITASYEGQTFTYEYLLGEEPSPSPDTSGGELTEPTDYVEPSAEATDYVEPSTQATDYVEPSAQSTPTEGAQPTESEDVQPTTSTGTEETKPTESTSTETESPSNEPTDSGSESSPPSDEAESRQVGGYVIGVLVPVGPQV